MPNSNIILPDTSLCAIVRDEKMNPAGGIERFLDSHVPYVERAIIADTGSVDGTREILEEVKSKYSNLKIVDFPFKGYADARNRALIYVKTKRVLILDADELLCHEKPQNDWELLKDFMEKNPSESYRLFFDTIFPNKIIKGNMGGHTLRLFNKKIKPHFENILWEQLKIDDRVFCKWVNEVHIKHFVPSRNSIKLKWENWYLDDFDGDGPSKISDDERKQMWEKISPSMREGFRKWKAYNPVRNNYI